MRKGEEPMRYQSGDLIQVRGPTVASVLPVRPRSPKGDLKHKKRVQPLTTKGDN